VADLQSRNQRPAAVSPSAYGCITIPFLLIALVPLAWGARANWKNGQLARDGVTVPGRVIELRHVPNNPSMSSGGTSGSKSGAGGDSPVVTFTTREGEERTAIGSVNRRPAPWTVGQTVDIVYDATNPSRADLRSEVDGWPLWFVIWCVVAAVPAAIASLPIVLRIRQRMQTTPL
jgi:hypothetical protein